MFPEERSRIPRSIPSSRGLRGGKFRGVTASADDESPTLCSSKLLFLLLADPRTTVCHSSDNSTSQRPSDHRRNPLKLLLQAEKRLFSRLHLPSDSMNIRTHRNEVSYRTCTSEERNSHSYEELGL